MRVAGDRGLKIYGILGYTLGHTVSPAIQNCAFDHYKLRAVYFAFERPPARFRFLMRNLKSLLLDGFNITVPYKETVIPYLDRLSPAAKALGAVNAVKKRGRLWVGYNTDVDGVLAGLREVLFKPKGKSAVILGAGGSARAVGFALAKSGVRQITVANRTRLRAQGLVRNLRNLFPQVSWAQMALSGKSFEQALLQTDLLVNATKVGLKKNDRSLISWKLFPKRKILVYDLIYNPSMTQLLQLARRLGHQIVNGETMLLYQGARAFEIWTAKSAPISKMRKTLHDAIRAH